LQSTLHGRSAALFERVRDIEVEIKPPGGLPSSPRSVR